MAALPMDSLRERKKQGTFDALRRSAVNLVAARGLAAVTVDDIVNEANVSCRTFFNYFSSKEDAISGIDQAVVAGMVESLQARPPAEPASVALRGALLEVYARFDADHLELMERLRVTRSEPHLLAHHVSCWAEAERQLVVTLATRRGTTTTSYERYIALVVTTTLSAARAAVMWWCEQEGRVPLVDELRFHLDVLGTGLAEPKEKKR